MALIRWGIKDKALIADLNLGRVLCDMHCQDGLAYQKLVQVSPKNNYSEDRVKDTDLDLVFKNESVCKVGSNTASRILI